MLRRLECRLFNGRCGAAAHTVHSRSTWTGSRSSNANCASKRAFLPVTPPSSSSASAAAAAGCGAADTARCGCPCSGGCCCPCWCCCWCCCSCCCCWWCCCSCCLPPHNYGNSDRALVGVRLDSLVMLRKVSAQQPKAACTACLPAHLVAALAGMARRDGLVQLLGRILGAFAQESAARLACSLQGEAVRPG